MNLDILYEDNIDNLPADEVARTMPYKFKQAIAAAFDASGLSVDRLATFKSSSPYRKRNDSFSLYKAKNDTSSRTPDVIIYFHSEGSIILQLQQSDLIVRVYKKESPSSQINVKFFGLTLQEFKNNLVSAVKAELVGGVKDVVSKKNKMDLFKSLMSEKYKDVEFEDYRRRINEINQIKIKIRNADYTTNRRNIYYDDDVSSYINKYIYLEKLYYLFKENRSVKLAYKKATGVSTKNKEADRGIEANFASLINRIRDAAHINAAYSFSKSVILDIVGAAKKTDLTISSIHVDSIYEGIDIDITFSEDFGYQERISKHARPFNVFDVLKDLNKESKIDRFDFEINNILERHVLPIASTIIKQVFKEDE